MRGAPKKLTVRDGTRRDSSNEMRFRNSNRERNDASPLGQSSIRLSTREDSENPLQNFAKKRKDQPLASLKEQRRILLEYIKETDKVLTPMEDPDPFYQGKKTFVVLNKNRVIYRFSEENSLYLWGRNSKFRMFFIKLLVNRWFNGLVMFTILVNCLFMIINGNIKPKWSEKYVENIFTSIYTVEAIVKIIGRGFVLHRFSYLRDHWNWLDFIVIVSAYILIILNQVLSTSNIASLKFLRAIRVLRVIKTMSVIPGLRMIVSALMASTKALRDAMLLTILGLSMFSLIGIQLFRGRMQQKCILTPPLNLTYSPTCANLSNIEKFNSENCSMGKSYNDLIREHFGHETLEEIYCIFCKLKNSNNYTNQTSYEESSGSTNLTMQFHMDNENNPESYQDNCNTYYRKFAHKETPDESIYNWTYFAPPKHHFNCTDYKFDNERWLTLERHYHHNQWGSIQLCKDNASCPSYTNCHRKGEDPNFGFTSFNNFYLALLSSFRVSLQDNWEELYLQILETNGTVSLFFFLALILLGSYYLINLILAVVATSYQNQRSIVENAIEEERAALLLEKEILKQRRNAEAQSIKNGVKHIKRRRRAYHGHRYRYIIFGSIRDFFLFWRCCAGDSSVSRIRNKLRRFFRRHLAEALIVALVILNTLLMALEKEPKTPSYGRFLEISNYIFTGLFTIEMGLKLFAFGPYDYFTEKWNVFDFVVVSLSLLEFILDDEIPNGISVLRAFRLIRLARILKLAKSWPTLAKLMTLIADSLSNVGYLTVVLLIVLVIFALAGMQTVGNYFYLDKSNGLPLRWHMHDFPHAFLVVFRIQCGEWIQNMWSCMHSVQEENSGGLIPVCLAIFLGVVFVGNLVVLNLFLALLLSSFSYDSLKTKSGKKRSAKSVLKSLREAGSRALKLKMPKERRKRKMPISRTNAVKGIQCNVPISELLHTSEAMCKKNTSSSRLSPIREIKDTGFLSQTIPSFEKKLSDKKTEEVLNLETIYGGITSVSSHIINDIKDHEENGCNNNSVNTNGSKVIAKPTEPVITKDQPSTSSSTEAITEPDSKWVCFRKQMKKIIKHSVFEGMIIFFVLASSISLAFDDVHLKEKPVLFNALKYLDYVFCGVFFIEMILKWIGLGFEKYFKNGWCLLDFGIVVISITAIIVETFGNVDLSFLRVLRSMRALRPLRAMSRFKGIQVVTNALFRSIPSIINVLVICIIFWLVFAIMGVNLFAGKMASCQWKETGDKVWHPKDFERFPNLDEFYEKPPINVTNRVDCDKLANLTGGKVHWKNLLVNFDNTAIAYVSLLQVATFKGWMPIMYAAVDSPNETGEQPIRDNNISYYFFFVSFIIFGAFFTLNLFISVVIDNFNQQKKKFELKGAELFLSESQRKAQNAMKNLKLKLPKQLRAIPESRWRERLYMIVTGDKFELLVLVVTLLNLVAMAVEHEGMSETTKNVVVYLSYMFVLLFTIEIGLRIVAMGKNYFYIAWNVFDFLLVFVSIVVNIVSIIILSKDGNSEISTSPWIPMLRLIRVVRILRVARVASGIRTLLFALMLSAPALLNVGSLLFLFMYMYAIFGMSQFGKIEKNGVINNILNFETFPNAFLLLFQMSTSSGWDGFLEPTLYVDENNSPCSSARESCMSTSFIGYFYFISYLLITHVVITNMYIAIILENFELASKNSKEEITADDFEHFFDMWQRFDKNGNGRLTIHQLSEMLDEVDEPLKIPKPNMQQIGELCIPICEGYELHIVDVASALIKRILGSAGNEISEEMEEELLAYFRNHSTTTLQSDDCRRFSNTQNYIDERIDDNGLVAEGKSEIMGMIRTNLDWPPLVGMGQPPKGKIIEDQLSIEAEVHSSADEPPVCLQRQQQLSRKATLVVRSSTSHTLAFDDVEEQNNINDGS